VSSDNPLPSISSNCMSGLLSEVVVVVVLLEVLLVVVGGDPDGGTCRGMFITPAACISLTAHREFSAYSYQVG
jgi:hypothetical protein